MLSLAIICFISGCSLSDESDVTNIANYEPYLDDYNTPNKDCTSEYSLDYMFSEEELIYGIVSESGGEIVGDMELIVELECMFFNENDFGLRFSSAAEQNLEIFSYVHEVFYQQGSRFENLTRVLDGYRIFFWTNTPLYDFALVMYELEHLGREHDYRTLHIPLEKFGQIEVLLPGQVYVVNQYLAGGTFPRSGITFVTENKEKYYFWMQPVLGDNLEIMLVIQDIEPLIEY